MLKPLDILYLLMVDLYQKLLLARIQPVTGVHFAVQQYYQCHFEILESRLT